MLNLIISGHVGADAKETEKSAYFNIATTKKGYTNSEGKVIPDKTIWITVFVNKKLAPYIKKGNYIIFSTDFINMSINNDKVYVSCNAVSLEFGGKSSGQSNDQAEPNKPENNTENGIQTQDDDLPF